MHDLQITSTTFRKMSAQENFILPCQLFRKGHSRERNENPLHLSLFQIAGGYMYSWKSLFNSRIGFIIVDCEQNESDVVVREPALKDKVELTDDQY